MACEIYHQFTPRTCHESAAQLEAALGAGDVQSEKCPTQVEIWFFTSSVMSVPSTSALELATNQPDRVTSALRVALEL